MKPTFRQALYGLAVADAIGNPLEFQSKVTEQDFLRSTNADELRISDDTQMALFCAEGLIQGHSPAESYKRWYQTQTRGSKGEGLLQFDSLFHREAPGTTCMSACVQLIANQPVRNDSKGNGGLMRLLPIPYLADTTDEAIEWAIEDTDTTHKHPMAAPCSKVLTMLHYLLLQGEDWNAAIFSAQSCLSDTAKDREIRSKVNQVLTSISHFEEAQQNWRAGVAEEALALAIGAVHYGRASGYKSIIEKAICFHGDSDTVGAIAGGLAVSAGCTVPMEWVNKLNALDAVNYICDLWKKIRCSVGF